MKNSLSLLFASTALTVAVALPVLATMHGEGQAGIWTPGRHATILDRADGGVPVIRVSDDDDDRDSGRNRRGREDDDDEDDDDDCDDDDCTSARGNPAPAGTVAPPANGLFGNGAPPVAVTN